ncbi:formate dehydrogenase H [Escherichia coli]|uniref:Formate dehydrogenase H n=1 Tax=Escherichia coli TaxID=562 RepID=A0A377B7E5_ECOLX|nr:formate dehydrogenase H [Escherichia coli]
MPTVLSRMAMQLKKTAWIIPVFMVSGCSLSPAIPVIRRLLSQLVFLRHCQPYFDAHHEASYSAGKYQSGICRNYLYRPFCSLRHAVLAGIFLIYLRRAHGKYAEKSSSQ